MKKVISHSWSFAKKSSECYQVITDLPIHDTRQTKKRQNIIKKTLSWRWKKCIATSSLAKRPQTYSLGARKSVFGIRDRPAYAQTDQRLCYLVLQSTISKLVKGERTSDGGNGNHSVSLPIMLIKIKVAQMLPSSYISSLLVSILSFNIWFPISINVRLNFGAKMVTFCIIHIGNRKILLKHHSSPPPPPPRVPTNPFARKCVLIFYIIYVKS